MFKGALKKIEIKTLNVSFGAREALKNVTFDIRYNEILSIIGPSNSGKSTLLLAINRMIERIVGVKVYGEILIDGVDVKKIGDAQELRRRIGLVYALPIPLPMSIKENILFGVNLKKKIRGSEADELVESTLKAAHLWDEVRDRLDLSAMRLSGGQQQRLCIARTLAVKPEVIMFDEPCSGLDPISTAKVEEAMKKLKQKHTIILVTNNTKQAARVSDRTAFLLTGELVEIDDTNKIFTTPVKKKTEEYVTGKFG